MKNLLQFRSLRKSTYLVLFCLCICSGQLPWPISKRDGCNNAWPL